MKSSNLFNFPMPLSDSDEAILMDILGTSRTLTIEGVKTGTIAELRTFVTDIEGLQNGEQSSSVFESSWTNVNKDVLIQDFQHVKESGDESRVSYTLTLVEGSVI
ncbi:MAG: hypothetical protein ACTSWD_05030 [Candidatus Heimdallarchaeota archaeon]